MTNYDNTNSGALFKNKDKQTLNHPDYKGNINVGGQEYWISSWLKESKNGVKYMSLSVTLKEDVKQQMNKPAQQQTTEEWVNDMDDIPF